ncbi:MAG: hypothetical protein RXQ96_05435 [Thermocladium sp.]
MIIESPILELVVRGIRKMGFGVWVITQSLGDVKPATLQSFGFSYCSRGLRLTLRVVGRSFLVRIT